MARAKSGLEQRRACAWRKCDQVFQAGRSLKAYMHALQVNKRCSKWSVESLELSRCAESGSAPPQSDNYRDGKLYISRKQGRQADEDKWAFRRRK